MLKDKILEKSKFTDLIRYERERSERTNIPFSLVYIDLSKIIKSEKSHDTKKVINTLIPSLRKIDHMGWIKKKVIGLLLPNTSADGALIVVKKFKEKIKIVMGENKYPIDFTICPYPSIDEHDKKIISPEATHTPKTKETILKMDYSRHYQMGDTITIDSSLMVELEDTTFHYLWQVIVKRMIDIIGALVAIILFFPLMLIIALFIRLTSKGPVLFRQERLGHKGRKFTFLKFRSMYVHNDEDIHRKYMNKLIRGDHKEINMGNQELPYYKIKNDPRITPLGKILRKTSLDELPQFLNVLFGQMSLVGPRPPIPYEFHNYQHWHKKRVLNVKPGITGLWQTNGRSQMTFDEMVRLDIYYANHWNLWLDIKILLNTFKAVFSCKGAD